MKVRYTPNDFARRKFRLPYYVYNGDGLTSQLERAIGRDSYERYMVAQDPFCGGCRCNSVTIILNRGESDPELMEFVNIGVVERLD